jgi:hypothetical protein
VIPSAVAGLQLFNQGGVESLKHARKDGTATHGSSIRQFARSTSRGTRGLYSPP